MRRITDAVLIRSFAAMPALIKAIAEAFLTVAQYHRGRWKLSQVVRGDLVLGRIGMRNPREITLLASVGSAIEDLAAAGLIVASAVR